MIRGAVAEEVTVAEAQVFGQVGMCALDSAGICERFVVRDVLAGVSANEAFVSLTDDICLASSAGELARRAAGRENLPQDADFYDCADDGVHAGAVAAGREDCDLHGGEMQGSDCGVRSCMAVGGRVMT